MPKYRKKPVVVEATQWFPGTPIGGVVERRTRNSTVHGIETLEGFMTLSEGDWVITGVAGEKYPCKDSIFKATYEEVIE